MISPDVLPLAARVAWWGTAWLRGAVSPDDLTDLLHADHVAHLVVDRGTGLSDEPGPWTLLETLAAGRSAGATAVAASFPEPGDPTGLAGPTQLTAAALEAGSVVLLLDAGVGLVPHEVGRAVEWTALPAARRPPPDVGEADRALRAALLAAADELARLDVARWRPEVADALHDLRDGVRLRAPAGVPQRAVGLAGRAVHLQRVVDLALEDEGAAVSASEIAARRAALLPLARAVRHALTAVCSPDGWPPADR